MRERAWAVMSSRIPVESMNVSSDRSTTILAGVRGLGADELALDVGGVGEVHLADERDRVHVVVAARAHGQLTELDDVLGPRLLRGGWPVGH